MTTIAVTGAAGRLGGQIVRLLAHQPGGHHVIALTRRPAELPAGVSIRIVDYGHPAALQSAMARVDTLVLVSSDGEATHVLQHHLNLVAAARAARTRNVVALSGLDADVSSPFCYAVSNGYTEQAIRDSGLGFTFVRASLFTEFFLGFLSPPAPVAGRDSDSVDDRLRLPAGDGLISLVSRADVGQSMAALALVPPTHRHHDITGPVAWHMDDVAAAVREQWHRPLTYRPTTPQQHMAELAGREEPWWVYAYTSMFASIREHRWELVTNEVEDLLARPPTGFSETLRQSAH